MKKLMGAVALAAAAGLAGPLVATASAAPVPFVCTYKVGGHNDVHIRTGPGSGYTGVGEARTGSTAVSNPDTVKNGFVKANWMDNAGKRHPGTWLSRSYATVVSCTGG